MPRRTGPLGQAAPPRAAARRASALVVLPLTLLGGLCHAQSAGRGLTDFVRDPLSRDRVGVLQVEPSLRLDGVMPGELLGAGGARAIAAPAWNAGLGPAGAFLLDTHVVRSIPAVWRMRLADLRSLSELSVSCEITAPNGQSNTLIHAGDPRSVIRVWVRPITAQIVAGATDETLVEGGVVLDLDLRDVRAAGPHSGMLVVRVEHF